MAAGQKLGSFPLLWSVGGESLVLREVALGLRRGSSTYRLCLAGLHQARWLLPGTSLTVWLSIQRSLGDEAEEMAVPASLLSQ